MLNPDQSIAIIFTVFYIIFLIIMTCLWGPVEPPLGKTVWDVENQDETGQGENQ